MKGVDAGVNLSNPCRFYRCVDFVIVKLGIKLKGHFQVPKNNPFHRDPLIFQLLLGTICVKNQPIQNLGTTYFQNNLTLILPSFFFASPMPNLRPSLGKELQSSASDFSFGPFGRIFFGEEKKGWWFQICFVFTPIPGEMIQFD